MHLTLLTQIDTNQILDSLAADIGVAGSVIALIALNIYQARGSRTISKELKPNGGESIKDEITQIKLRLAEGAAKMEHLDDSVNEIRRDIRDIRNRDG